MILYKWVGDDGLVRWGADMPDAKWHARAFMFEQPKASPCPWCGNPYATL